MNNNLFKRAALAALTLILFVVGNNETYGMSKVKNVICNASATLLKHKKTTAAVLFGFYCLQVFRAKNQDRYNNLWKNDYKIGATREDDTQKDAEIFVKKTVLLKAGFYGLFNNNITHYFFKVTKDFLYGCYCFVIKPQNISCNSDENGDEESN